MSNLANQFNTICSSYYNQVFGSTEIVTDNTGVIKGSEIYLPKDDEYLDCYGETEEREVVWKHTTFVEYDDNIGTYSKKLILKEWKKEIDFEAVTPKTYGSFSTRSGYKYENPKTGEIFFYNRKGVYRKDGVILVFKGKALQKQTVIKCPKDIKLNKPFRTPAGLKKYSVYVKNDEGNIVKVNFGNVDIDFKDQGESSAREGFYTQYKCGTDPGPRWKAKYWSCKFWESK